MNSTLKKTIVQIFMPVARFWIRYIPLSIFKSFLWQKFWSHNRCFVTRTRFGFKITGQTREIIQRYLYYFGIWEPNLTYWLTKQLSEGDVFIDVGANIGYYTLLAATLVGDTGHVVAIEASPRIYSELKQNIMLNHFKNVRTLCKAATAVREQVFVYHAPPEISGETSIVPGIVASEDVIKDVIEVEGVPLYELLEEEDIQRARLIKIDVEGAEWQVIQGLQPLLEKLRKDVEIVVEISPDRLVSQGKDAADILSIFELAGFYPYELENDYGASSYLFAKAVGCPTRLITLTKQSDVIFSRIDANQL